MLQTLSVENNPTILTHSSGIANGRFGHKVLKQIQYDYILETIKTATVIYVVFFIYCNTTRIVYVPNGLSFARERLSKYRAQLNTPVGNCVKKW